MEVQWRPGGGSATAWWRFVSRDLVDTLQRLDGDLAEVLRRPGEGSAGAWRRPGCGTSEARSRYGGSSGGAACMQHGLGLKWGCSDTSGGKNYLHTHMEKCLIYPCTQGGYFISSTLLHQTMYILYIPRSDDLLISILYRPKSDQPQLTLRGIKLGT